MSIRSVLINVVPSREGSSTPTIKSHRATLGKEFEIPDINIFEHIFGGVVWGIYG